LDCLSKGNHKWKECENKVLKGIFGPEKKGSKRRTKEEIYSLDQIIFGLSNRER
jgi:hypothetical protein